MATNFRMNQGASWAKVITIKDETGLTPIDLTGALIRGQMRASYASAAIVASFVGTVIDATNGICGISLTAATTAAIPAATYYYDVEWVTATGIVTRILEGKIIVRPEVTK